MHGNVFEWCQDWLDTYPGGVALDPQGPATGSDRVVRGGLWDPRYWPWPWVCRSAGRAEGSAGPGGFGPVYGFRVVLAPAQP